MHMKREPQFGTYQLRSGPFVVLAPFILTCHRELTQNMLLRAVYHCGSYHIPIQELTVCITDRALRLSGFS